MTRDDTEQRDSTIQRFVTARRRMELGGLLGGGVVHDINNPLNIIMNYSYLAAEELPPAHPVRPYLSEIDNQCRRIAELTNTLLRLLRAEAATPGAIEPADLLAAVELLVRKLTMKSQIDLTICCAEGLPPIEGRWQQMVMVLSDLVLNARQAVECSRSDDDEQRWIRLSANALPGTAASMVRFTVDDSGQGLQIPPEADPYDLRCHSWPGVADSVVGAGLWLARMVVSEHGGAISHEALKSGGMRFKVDLPVFRPKAGLPDP